MRSTRSAVLAGTNDDVTGGAAAPRGTPCDGDGANTSPMGAGVLTPSGGPVIPSAPS